MKTRRSQFLAASVAAAAAASAQAARAAGPVSGAPPTKIQIGYVPATLFAPVFVAAELGYFRDNGLDANLTPIVAGQDAMALLATNQLDVVAAALSAAFYNGVNRGLGIRFVASTPFQPKQGHPSALMVRQDLWDSGARSLSWLRGKKFGWLGGAGAASAYYVARILRPAGYGLKDIEIVNIAAPDQGIALERKAIDAVFASAPFTEAFVRQTLAQPIGFPPAGISLSGIFFGPNLAKNPDIARAAMAACRKAAVDLQGAGYFSPVNLAASAKYTRQPVEVIKSAGRYDLFPDLRIDQPTIEDVQKEFLHQGILAYKTLLNESQFVARY